jgi:hypothetical protein
MVVGRAAEVGDVLLGDDNGESGMHDWTSFRGVVGTVICSGCSGLAVR